MTATTEARLGYATPRAAEAPKPAQTPPSSKKVPEVFRGREVRPWTPRGQDTRNTTLPRLSTAKGPPMSMGAQDRGVQAETGVLREVIGSSTSASGGESGRGSTAASEQRTSSDSPDLKYQAPGDGCVEMDSEPVKDLDDVLLDFESREESAPAQKRTPAQWDQLGGPRPKPRPIPPLLFSVPSANAPPSISSAVREAEALRAGAEDVSAHSSRGELSTPRGELPMPVGSSPLLEVNGILLDGKMGIPTEVQGNLGAFMWHMRSSQGHPAAQAQCCVFLFKYASYQQSSRLKAAKAGAVQVLLEFLARTKEKLQHQALIAELAIWCLSMLCVEPSIAAEAVHAGAVKLVSFIIIVALSVRDARVSKS
jgi:hypothetical protein